MTQNEIIVLKPELVVDGTGRPPMRDTVVAVDGSRILFVGAESGLDIPNGRKYSHVELPGKTILPGLIDSHVHLALGVFSPQPDPTLGVSRDIRVEGRPTVGPSSYIDLMRNGDGVMLASGIVNAGQALRAGVTSVKDCGERNRVGFDLRDAWKLGLFEGPRILVCGRPLTITGGHFHFCNDCECDGPWEVRRRARQMIHEGADFIKVMAGGGSSIFGGYARTDNSVRAFTDEELRAAVEEAERVGMSVTAHCESYDSVGSAARAGVSVLTHLGHLRLDGSRGFDEEAARTMAEKGLYADLNMRIQVDARDALREKRRRGERLTEKEAAALEFYDRKIEHKQEVLRGLLRMGVEVTASSDGVGLGECNRLVRSLELMVEAGMTPLEAIVSATGRAAEAEPRLRHIVGSIAEGKEADLIAVDGDPTRSISALWQPAMVMQAGREILRKIDE